MSPENFDALIEAIAQLTVAMKAAANRPYTLTGAADWPLLVVLGGAFGSICLGMVGIMWYDLKKAIQQRKEDQEKSEDVIHDKIRRLEERCDTRHTRMTP